MQFLINKFSFHEHFIASHALYRFYPEHKYRKVMQKTIMFVKNMHSGSDGGGCGWLAKWKEYKGIAGDVPCMCCRKRKAVHGGHVIKADPNATKERYRSPLR